MNYAEIIIHLTALVKICFIPFLFHFRRMNENLIYIALFLYELHIKALYIVCATTQAQVHFQPEQIQRDMTGEAD